MKSGMRSWPILAVLVSLAVQLTILVVHPMPGSFRKYTLAAEQYLSGDLPSDRLMDLSPFYLDLTVMVTRMTGGADQMLIWLQVLLMALAAGFLAELYQRRFGRALSMAGVGIFLLDRQSMVYQRILEPEACLLFFLLGWIFFVERTVHPAAGLKDEVGLKHGAAWRPALLAGLLAGAGLMTRPTFLPLLILVPLYFFWRLHSDRRSWLTPTLAFGGPVLVVVLILAWRALALTDDPRTPVMNPGTVFYEGNQALSGGTSAIYPTVVQGLGRLGETRPDSAHEHYRTVARAATGENLSISEVNAYWGDLVLKQVRAEPVRFIRLLRDKLIHVFHAYRWHDVSTAWRYDQNLRLPSMPFALLSALALVGMLFEARRFQTAFLFYALAGLQVAVMLVFYVSARQRLVLLPALIYFALVGLERLWSGWRSERREAVLLIGFVLLLALCFVLPNDLMRDDHYLKEGSARAEALLAHLQDVTRVEPMAAHTDLALEAMAQAPWVGFTPAYFPQQDQTLEVALAQRLAERETFGSASARFDLAVVFLRADRLEDASRLLEDLVEEDRLVYRGARQASLPRFYLSRVEVRRGNRAKAVALLVEALAQSPGNAFVLADLAALTDKTEYREALEAGYGVIDAQYFLGRALLFHGRGQDAADAFNFVVDRLPEFRTGQIYLAVALAAAGRVDEGAAQYLEAVKQQPDPLILSGRVSELFRTWATLHLKDPQVRLFSARVLHEYGYFREALKILESSAQDSDHQDSDHQDSDPPPAMQPAFEEEIRRIKSHM